MALGSVNVPGAEALERRQTQTALEARMDNVERALSSSTGAQGKPGGVATLDNTGKVPAEQLPTSMPASDVPDWAKASQKPTYTAGEVGAKASDWAAFYMGTSAPVDKTKLWIDTTANTGGLKYWNGSAWVTVPVGYT